MTTVAVVEFEQKTRLHGKSETVRRGRQEAVVGGREEYQLEHLDLWLGAFAGGYVKPPDEIKADLPKKRASQWPISLVWMEAMRDPAVSESNALLSRIVLEQLPSEKPTTYRLFWHLYLRENANPAEAEAWRTSTDPKDVLKLKMLRKGKRWILRRLSKLAPDHVLAFPDPIDPKGFVQNSYRQRTIAKRVFYSSVERHGPKEAIKHAANASRFSERHVRNLIPKEDRSVSKKPMFGSISIDYHFTNDDGEVERHTLTRDLKNNGERIYKVGENSQTAAMSHAEANSLASDIQATLAEREERRQRRLKREEEGGFKK